MLRGSDSESSLIRVSTSGTTLHNSRIHMAGVEGAISCMSFHDIYRPQKNVAHLHTITDIYCSVFSSPALTFETV